MNNSLLQLYPDMISHEGIWEGEYIHIDLSGNILDQHRCRIECVFPKQGEIVYIQKNEFNWADGRKFQVEFDGTMKGNKLYWNTETFEGYGWSVNENIFVLELDRKDEPGVSFTEMIVLADNKKHRARTWHWFKEGKCFKRTLCNESKIT